MHGCKLQKRWDSAKKTAEKFASYGKMPKFAPIIYKYKRR
jgi:hypothetical protein